MVARRFDCGAQAGPEIVGRSGSFRHDLNALRAIAVVAVVLFHFQVPGFSGGFVGVDVFFVISGFLMTSIIVTGLEAHTTSQNPFSVWQFYLARARRILPALIAMVGILLMLGWWVLPSIDYQQLAKQGIYSLIFISNIRYQRDAGYFDAESHEKWLLHTWSLSVEWQFYLLFPLLLMLAWKLKPGRKTIVILISAALTASLLISIWRSQQDPAAAFFLLQSRAWQMLAGGLVFLLAPQAEPPNAIQASHRQPAVTTLGLLLIAAAIYLFDANTRWPGLNAILPVAGTMLILWNAQQARWMQLKFVQWLGITSYSIYLWHWPVMVALVYMEEAGQASVIVTGLALSFALGAWSYQVVEKPTRLMFSNAAKTYKNSDVRAAATLFAAMLLVIIPARIIDKQDGIGGRLSAAVEKASAEALNVDPRRSECLGNSGFEFPWCQYGGDDIRAVVIGDSHAASVFTAVLEAVSQQSDNAGILASGYNGCPTILDPDSLARTVDNADECKAFNAFILQQLQSVAKNIPVIVVNRSSVYLHGSHRSDSADFQRPLITYPEMTPGSKVFVNAFKNDLISSACTISEKHHVALLRPIPEMDDNVPKALARQLLLGQSSEINIRRSDYDRRHADVIAAQDAAAAQCGVQIVDVADTFCNENVCMGSMDGRPLYYDEDHLSEFGNKKIVRSLF